MHTDNNQYRSRNEASSTWERFVSACTQTLGGFFRADGTIFRDPNTVPPGRDLDFADLTQRTHQRLRHQETLRQANIEAITGRAYEQLGATRSTRDIDPDWLNLFFSYAQDVSSRAMQEIWAQGLALEITQPGSISKHSLGFLRNCDTWELAAFRRVATTAFIAANGHPFIFKAKSHFSNTDPIFSEQRLLSHCISAGLVHDSSTPITAGFKFTYEGRCQVVRQDPFSPGDNVGYYVQRFTRIGSDLYRLINQGNAKTKSGQQKRLVWDFLTDYLELGVEEAATSR